MTEQKLYMLESEMVAKKDYKQQIQTGWYFCRLAALPVMRSHGKFDRVVRTYGYRCFNCKIVNPHLTVDHILRRVEGGTSNIDNLRLLCLADHRKKDNKVRKVKNHEDINLVSCISTR
jgi:hypothetical protein